MAKSTTALARSADSEEQLTSLSPERAFLLLLRREAERLRFAAPPVKQAAATPADESSRARTSVRYGID